MGSKGTRTRHTRRDRRKAKASNYAREGTKNPRKVGHHSYAWQGIQVGAYRKVGPESPASQPLPEIAPRVPKQQQQQQQPVSQFRSVREIDETAEPPSLDDLLAKFPSMGDPKEFARKERL